MAFLAYTVIGRRDGQEYSGTGVFWINVSLTANSGRSASAVSSHAVVNKLADLNTLAGGLTELESLNLGGSDFGDDGLAVVCGIPTLRTLHLGHVAGRRRPRSRPPG